MLLYAYGMEQDAHYDVLLPNICTDAASELNGSTLGSPCVVGFTFVLMSCASMESIFAQNKIHQPNRKFKTNIAVVHFKIGSFLYSPSNACYPAKEVAADSIRKLLRIIPFHADIYMDHIVAPIYFFLVWTLDKVPNSSLPPIYLISNLRQFNFLTTARTEKNHYYDHDVHQLFSEETTKPKYLPAFESELRFRLSLVWQSTDQQA